MKILLASYLYLLHVGGLWTYADLLQRRLRKPGHEVDIFGHAKGMQKYHMVNIGKSIDKSKIKDPIYDSMIKYFENQRKDVAEWIRWKKIERYSYEAAAVCFGLKKYDLIHAQDIISTRALWRVKPKDTPLLGERLSSLRRSFPSILKLAHVMVLPSLQDNQPFSVMEAQISGKAVVVSDAGGLE